jgi:hypothetical protein
MNFMCYRLIHHQFYKGDQRSLSVYTHNILIGLLERKRPPGKAKRWWEDNMKIEVKEILCADVACMVTDLGLLNTATHICIIISSREFLDELKNCQHFKEVSASLK